nr:SAF domain-containing protein [Propionicimonas sp.]
MGRIDSLRRAFRWHRRTFAALFAALAVLAGLNALSASSSNGTLALVAARTMSAGDSVAESDLAVVRVPAELLADGAFTDVAQVVGHTAVVEVPARAVLVPSVLLEPNSRLPAGQVALPVRFGDAAAVGLLRVGGRIDVLGAAESGSGYGVVAADVRVMAVTAAADGGLLGGSQAPLVLLTVTSTQAAAITAAASVSTLGFSLR